MKKLSAILLSLLCALPFGLRAQYYDQGAAPASIRWMQMRTPHNRIIYPSDYGRQAARVANYLDTVRLQVAHGYRVGTMRMPVVLQTYDMASNGLVMLAPKRMELIVPPPAAMTPEPWLKQLVTHESRHTVQYNLVNQHFIKGVSWVLGQQGSLIGVALFPIWAMEGDAVMAETELSTFGRGLQPSFTIEYRAMLAERDYRRWAVDKWFCGSYKDFMPDHYQMGYQMTTYAWTRYGENVWDKVGSYASKYPFLIFTNKIALWKYYRTSVNHMKRDMLADLDAYWSSLPVQENSARIIPTRVTSYTQYTSPLAAEGRILAFKSDMDRPRRVVEVDPQTGAERVLFHTGSVNSPLVMNRGGGLAWSEIRYSKFWAQGVNSVLCVADPVTKKPRVVREAGKRVLFPTHVGQDGLAWVQFEQDGSYTIRMLGREEPLWHFPLPVSVHGLAWDDLSKELYYIAVGEGGMYINALSDKNGHPHTRTVKPASYCTINDLRAEGGMLYFTSTQSGRDEGHAMLAATGEEIQISTSRYGSFSPAPATGATVMTTYTPQGYMLAEQPDPADPAMIPQRTMPHNTVNPPRVHWDTKFNMDSIVVADTVPWPVKRFRRVPHMFNLHSWAPVAYDAGNIISERSLNVNAGVTLLSQDLLNSTIIELRYAWVNQSSLVGAKLQYYGLAPKFEIDMEYGGGDQIVSRPSQAPAPSSSPKPYFDVSGRVFLPIYFDAGYHTRLLQPAVEMEYLNGMVYDFGAHIAGRPGQYKNGINKAVGELQYSDQVRMASRDFLPRWGWAVRGTVATEPFNDEFGTLWSGYGRVFLPGLAPHHSLMVRGAVQTQSDPDAYYHFRQKELFPTGADYDRVSPRRYCAMAVDYQFPVAYPDWGLSSIFYLKRIRLNLGANYAHYLPFPSQQSLRPAWQDVWSFGGDITIDTNLLRAPAPATNFIRISIYRPSDGSGIYTGVYLSIPL